MSKENQIKRRNENNERKITGIKNVKQLKANHMENKPGLVTTLLRHQQAGFELIGLSQEWQKKYL